MRRPSMSTVLLLVHLSILLLPLLGIAGLRIYDDELIRRTESELLAQGAVVVVAYREMLLDELPERPQDHGPIPPSLDGLVDSGDLAAIGVLQPTLRLDRAAIKPRAGEGRAPDVAPDSAALRAGERLTPLIEAAGQVTLAGIRVLDDHGVVVATTRSESGMSLLHLEEVQAALRGNRLSVLRERHSDEPPPPLASIRRWSKVRVFVSLPVLVDGRVRGAVLLSRSPLSVNKALYENRDLLLTSAAVLLGMVLLMSTLTTLSITRSIHSLMSQARSVAAGRSRGVEPLRHPVTLEVEQLSDAIVQMAAALEERADYIRTFATHVSHEFKTPLASLRGTVELLQDHLEEMTLEERQRFLSNLERETLRLDRLVRRLLELARADVLQPSAEGLDPAPVIRAVLARRKAEGQAVDWEEGPPVTLPVSPETLEAVLDNLLENARQHAGLNAQVTLIDRVEARGPAGEGACVWYLRVKDNGPGISAGNAARIYDPFFTTARASGGTGLGLSITRALLRSAGGEVRHVPEAGGACFEVSLPGVRRVGTMAPGKERA